MRLTAATAFLILYFCFLGINHQAAAQESVQAAFDRANELLEKGEFYEALRSYHEIENRGMHSSALYINMGYTAVQTDSLGLAKYYFLKTLKYFPAEKDIREQAEQALEFINSGFSRQAATLPKLPWDVALDWLIEKPGAYGVFWTGYVLGLFVLLLLFAKWFGLFSLKHHYRLITILTIAVLCVISLAYYVSYNVQRYDDAVMIHEQSTVFSKPDEHEEPVTSAYEGYVLRIDYTLSKNEPDWFYVRLSNGQKGWIERTKILPV